MQEQTKRKKLKSQIGIVISNKMDKTAVVRLESFTTHKLYKKIIRRKRKVKAHDPENAVKIGDKVRIIQTRPLSKEKRYRIIEVIKNKNEK